MHALNWLLIHLGNAAQWLWGALKLACGAIWGGLDAVLNPVLSRVLAVLNPLCTVLGDAVYAILSPLPVWLGLTLISAVTGVVMLIAFRYTSNQQAIGRARDDITANLLALKLFKDEIGVTFRSQGRILGALGRLQWHMFRPVLIMLLPMLLLLGQMGVRYQWRPLHPGEVALIRLHLDPAQTDVPEVTLEPSPGVRVEAGPVPGGGELVWRVRAGEPGRHLLRFNVAGTTLEKELVVGDGFQRVSAERLGSHWTSQILHPTERLLPHGSPVASIEIAYAGVHSYIYGANWWILYFFVVSMVFALLFKPVFKVRF
jgi:uncharacterized membrane protein (DUF106 family)